jgi:hypothetical protein
MLGCAFIVAIRSPLWQIYENVQCHATGQISEHMSLPYFWLKFFII